MTLAAFQLRSLGTFCVLLESSTITAAVTFTTAGGGCANDFNSVKFVYKSAYITHIIIIIIIINIFKVASIMKLLLGPHRYRRRIHSL